MPASPKMSADEGSLTGAALGMIPPPSDDGALGGHLPSSFNSWWGPEEYSWLLAEVPNDIALDPIEQLKRRDFLLEYGDYTARVWNSLVKASKELQQPLNMRVVKFRDNLNKESQDSSSGDNWIRLLERCVEYLIEQGLDIDLDMAKLAILVYSKRNILCHAGPGDAAASDPAALRRVIEQAKQRLPDALPKALSRCFSTWQRILAFYGNSQSFIKTKLGAKFATALLEPDSSLQTENTRRRMFEERIFDERIEATYQTINERIPVTSCPVPSQKRTKRSVSDPLTYLPQKRRAVGSLDSDEGTDGKPAAPRSSTVAFGNVEDARKFQEIYGTLDYVFDKNRKAGENALKEVRKVVNNARANVDRTRRGG